MSREAEIYKDEMKEQQQLMAQQEQAMAQAELQAQTQENVAATQADASLEGKAMDALMKLREQRKEPPVQ